MPHKKQAEAIVRSGVVAEVLRMLVEMRVPVTNLLAQAGLDPHADYENPLAAVPLAPTMRLFELAAQATGRPDFAILYTKNFRVRQSGLFGEILRSVANVREMLEAFVEFYPVYSLPVACEFRLEEGVGRLSWSYPPAIAAAHIQYNVFTAAALVERIRCTVEPTPHWVPLSAEFAHIAPDCPDALKAIFGSRVRFGADYNAISIDAAKLAMPLMTANPSRFALSSDLARRWMEEMRAEDDTITRAQRIIETRLGSAPTNLESVAQTLGLNPRSLQWRLGREGTTFERLLSDARRNVAEQLLLNTDRPLTSISYDLGFSNPSAFTRAAQRWFGQSPRQLRNAARKRAAPRQDRRSLPNS